MKKIQGIAALFLCVLAVTFSGCGNKDKHLAAVEAGEEIVLPYTEALRKYGIAGNVTLSKRPERVVSLVNTPVLTLHALGVKQIGLPDSKVVNWPTELKAQAKLFQVGMKANIDIESVIALKPDLVFLSYTAKDTYGKILTREKIPVYYVDAGPTVSYKSVKELTEVLLNAFGKNLEAEKKIRDNFTALEEKMTIQQKKNAGKKVLVLQSAPPRHFVQNKNGTVGSMLALLGFENVASNQESNMALLDMEQALTYAPDVVVSIGAMPSAEEQQKVMEDEFSKQSNYWNKIDAIKNKKVIYLPITYATSGGINVVDNINGLITALDKLGV